MLPLRPFAVLLLALGACSSSNGGGATGVDASADGAAIDGSIGPLLCSLPVPATCPMTAPCTFAGWGCAPTAPCDGYDVVTDGTWTYYYSSYGGALAGEVAVADAAFVSCPFAFTPPTSCAPLVAGQCAAAITDAGNDAAPDTGSADDAGAGNDANADAAGADAGNAPDADAGNADDAG